MPTDPPAASDAVHRLHDMETEEVSLVDRAANKRSFIVVKRAPAGEREDKTMAAGAEIKEGPNGLTAGEVEIAKAPPMPPGANAPAAAAPPAAPPPPKPAAPPAAPVAAAPASPVKLTQDMKAGLTQLLQQCTSQLSQAAQLVNAAELVADESQVVLDALADAMLATTDALEDGLDAIFGAAGPEGAADDGGAAPPPQAPTAAPGGPPPAQKQFTKRLELVAAKRVTAKAAAEAKLTTAIAKVGAKMSASRLARLSSAYSEIQSVLAEVTPAKAAEEAPAAETDTEKAATPPDPAIASSAGAGNAPPGKKKKQPGEMPAEAAATANAPTAQPQYKAEVEALTKQVGELTKIVKSQAVEISAVRAHRGESNSIPVEGSSSSKVDDYSWPMDMADDSVEKPGSKFRFGG